ncbi:MAG: HEAT repeat domain-containing protein [Nitrospira sp.]|nr:HEAT repeat domain-containing protein [Nitrospira sp.]
MAELSNGVKSFMADEKEKLPLDARLLSDAIIELNISRRNVFIYPRGHPSVEKSLNKAFDFLQKLFELRPDISLAIAKDILIIDDFFLDRKNPVYREFALHLNKMNIASVTFITGLTKDEIYEFHRFLSEDFGDSSVETLQEAFNKIKLIHIKADFINYDAFVFKEGETDKEAPTGQLWEKYIHGLLDGTLQTEALSNMVQEIPPIAFAGLLNQTAADNLKEETYDRVITTYLRKSSERAFTSKELKKLLDFINGLRPDLKKQFLSSTVRTVSEDIDSVETVLRETPVDKVIDLLTTINEQQVAIPEALKNLLDKFSRLHKDKGAERLFRGNLIADDILISPDVLNLLSDGNFEIFVTATYQKEIQKLLDFDSTKIAIEFKELRRECSDECIERDFNITILELISSDIISEEEYTNFINTLKEHLSQFIGTGQYGQVLIIFSVLESNAERGRFSEITSEALQYYHTSEFISFLVDSLRIMGRLTREESLLICNHYGERIIAPLLDALIEEGSQAVRRFLISLITSFGDKANPEVIKRLGDNRWFVKRNMLFILSECGGKDVIPHARPYCHHENPKVGYEAIKCLLKAGDKYCIGALKENLLSESSEASKQALALSGTFRVNEVVPDLIQMLRKKAISGADFHEKIPIVKALGAIGDPRALNALRDVLSTKSLFFKDSIEKLKEEIYITLKNYSYNDMNDLIEAGMKSKNERIRVESLRVKRSHNG